MNLKSQIDEQNNEQIHRYEAAEKPFFIHWSDLSSNEFSLELKNNEFPISVGHFVSQTLEVDLTSPKPKTIVYSGNCQGSLIGPDLFLTGRHCLPHDLRQKNQSCKDRIKIVFPKVNETISLNIVDCLKINSIADGIKELNENDPQPDWVILKLNKKLNKRFMGLNSEGVSDGQKLYAFLPLVSTNKESYEYKKITCEAIQNSFLLPEFEEKLSPLVYLHCDHDVTQGFSGTTLFSFSDEKGYQPVSVLSHLRDVKISEDSILVSKFIVGSNFTCVESKNNKHCAFDPEQRKIKKEQIILKKLKEMNDQISEQVDLFIKEANHPIVWKKMDLTLLPKLPKGYEDYFMNEEKQPHDLIQESNLNLFTQLIIPIYAECVKNEFLIDGQSTQIPEQVPVFEVFVFRNEMQKIDFSIELKSLPVDIRLGPNNTYVLVRKDDLAPLDVPPQNIIGGRFTHTSVLIPACQ